MSWLLSSSTASHTLDETICSHSSPGMSWLQVFILYLVMIWNDQLQPNSLEKSYPLKPDEIHKCFPWSSTIHSPLGHSPPLTHCQCKFLGNKLHLFPPNSLYKSPISPKMADVFLSPGSPAADGLDCRPQGLVLFLTNLWLNKPFLSEKLLSLKVYV